MSQEKKKIRENFRNTCFKRDKYCCVMCGKKSSPEKALEELDCHHIQNPKKIIHQGYTPLNGISLCSDCHQKAEEYHSTGIAHPGYSMDDLYKAIGSSLEKAIEASKKLK